MRRFSLLLTGLAFSAFSLTAPTENNYRTYSGTQYFGGITAGAVCRQGWGLVVLAEGVLR